MIADPLRFSPTTAPADKAVGKEGSTQAENSSVMPLLLSQLHLTSSVRLKSYPLAASRRKTLLDHSLRTSMSHPYGVWKMKTHIFETTTVVLRSQYLGHFSARCGQFLGCGSPKFSAGHVRRGEQSPAPHLFVPYCYQRCPH